MRWKKLWLEWAVCFSLTVSMTNLIPVLPFPTLMSVFLLGRLMELALAHISQLHFTDLLVRIIISADKIHSWSAVLSKACRRWKRFHLSETWKSAKLKKICSKEMHEKCVVCCRWRRWGDTATVWPSAQLVLRVRLTTSATTPTQNTSAGTGRPQRYVKRYKCVSVPTLTQFASL